MSIIHIDGPLTEDEAEEILFTVNVIRNRDPDRHFVVKFKDTSSDAMVQAMVRAFNTFVPGRRTQGG